ncbi:thiamine pyrophosphate-dependent enzyme [Mycobacterium sp. 852002-40037_SCH5390672]|uniref:thiamine pyrophosphate-dependent enzyme n=1 Tax=Mycobacterium sp. 852002-40037_SCH5390672 TaxID=1834089 RepID=UPI000805EC6A|nr:thiamine pyrophosphate-dependent enzyme [Mycobacterium sp. 852002-40037_SCH5390672]OBB93057.1 dehydrogenase [Mycobacterium sp. 852002-40037_SCH5390672]
MTRTTETSAALALDDELELYRRMWVLRLIDMASEDLRVGGPLDDTVRPEFGQEAVAIGTVAALRPGDLVNATTPEFQHAQQICPALPLGPAIADMIGRKRRAGGTADWKRSLANESALGQSTLFALGDANTQRLAGEGKVSVCVVGGGDANSVEFTTAAKIAVQWRLPVVFVVQNIRGGTSARRRAYEFDSMPMLSVDGRDVVAVADSVAEAVHQASAGGGPTLVEAITYQTNHPIAIDPLVFACRRLMAAGSTGEHLYEVERGARQLVAEAVAAVKAKVWAQQISPAPESKPWPAAS